MKNQSGKRVIKLTTREKKLIREAYDIGHFHASDSIAKRHKYPMGGDFGVYEWRLNAITLKENGRKL
jgi:hypothetical protein